MPEPSTPHWLRRAIAIITTAAGLVGLIVFATATGVGRADRGFALLLAAVGVIAGLVLFRTGAGWGRLASGAVLGFWLLQTVQVTYEDVTTGLPFFLAVAIHFAPTANSYAVINTIALLMVLAICTVSLTSRR